MDIRSQFALPEGAYLLSHSAGCLPLRARSGADKFFSAWEVSGEPWRDWLEGVYNFCAELGALLEVSAEDLCPQTNLSSALTKVIGSLPPRAGRTHIAYSELDFPSMGFVCERAGLAGDYYPRLVASVDGAVPLESWESALREGVQVAHITHVFSENSRQQQVPEIVALCRKYEVYTVVDIAQSVGVVPIDLDAWGADFVTGSCLKWLCGGPGAGFLWVNPAIASHLEPSDVGWFSHARPFEFNISNFEFREGALRFWGGTPSVLPYMVAAESIGVLVAVGLKDIRAKNLALTAQIIDLALEKGISVNTPICETDRGGTVAVSFPDNESAALNLRLAGIHCDWRPRAGVRFSPHVYNNHQDIQRLKAALDALAG